MKKTVTIIFAVVALSASLCGWAQEEEVTRYFSKDEMPNLMARGYMYGESRVIVGTHWQSDVDAMMRHGFKPIGTEWWHFTLKDEPFPDTYFTFPVKTL